MSDVDVFIGLQAGGKAIILLPWLANGRWSLGADVDHAFLYGILDGAIVPVVDVIGGFYGVLAVIGTQAFEIFYGD